MSMTEQAEYANELVEKIDAGEIDPEDVDIEPFALEEDKVLTPELAARLEGTGKIERYNELWNEKTERDVAERERERAAEANEARSLLADLERGHLQTAEVELPGVDNPVKVRRTFPRVSERKLFEMDQADSIEPGEPVGYEQVEQSFEAMVEILCGPGDASPGDPDYRGMVLEPEEYADPEQWREVYDTYGVVMVRDLFDQLTAPAVDSYEVAEKFRDEPAGAEPTGDVQGDG